MRYLLEILLESFQGLHYQLILGFPTIMGCEWSYYRIYYWYVAQKILLMYEQFDKILYTLKYSDEADNITRWALIRFPSEEHNVTSWRTPSVKNDARLWTNSDEWCSHSTCIFIVCYHIMLPQKNFMPFVHVYL